MNYSRSFTFMFDDEKWLSKSLFSVVIMLVPILNLAWLGYCLDVIRNSCKGVPELPEWDNIGDKFIDGLKYIIARWIYALPVVIIIVFPLLFVALPVIFSQDNERLAGFLWVIFAFVVIAVISIVMIYSLVLSFISPAIAINYTRNDSFGSFFQIKKIFMTIRKDLTTYSLAWLLGFAAIILASIASFIIGIFVGWVPCLGSILSIVASMIASVWGSLVVFHLYGQVSARLSTTI